MLKLELDQNFEVHHTKWIMDRMRYLKENILDIIREIASESESESADGDDKK